MTTFQADPSNFADLLQMVRDGFEINLASGEYKGPFTLDKAIAIRGNGPETIIFAENQPALRVTVPGVRLENLAIERTVGGNSGEVAIFAEPNTKPILSQVKLTGVAENVEWSGASWDIPALLDFGEVKTNRQVERGWELQLASACQVLCDLNWLQVRSNYLSPGLQNLEVVLNSRDIPTGTNLSGLIFLLAADGRREIEISAKIIATQTTHLEIIDIESKETDNEISSEDWGYDLWQKAAENLIRDVEGKAALERYDNLRDRASNLISEILGSQPILFYVRNRGVGQNSGEQKWELTIATDRDDVELPPILQERNKTLSLLAVVSEDGYRGLGLLSARLLSQEQGREDGFTVPYYIRLRPERQYRRGVAKSAVKRMREMPVVGDRVPTEKQLLVWKAFLNIEERIAKERQFCVPFPNHNYGAATRKITFEVESNSATVEPTSGKFLTNNDFWERAKKARNEDIKLLEIESDKNGEQVEYLLGNVEEINEERRTIQVRLDAELVEKITEGRYQLPKRGFLSFEAAGDLIQIKRKRRALDDLNNGKTQNPYLGEFFFDASKAKESRRYIKLEREKLLLPTANDDQIAALEAVLAAPDLVLIQGPPGTGKTTVIAEICYQIALRGGKTLIASQANLAVDNALSRLVHSPVIRALRKGRAERVEEEGLPFLEDKVIGTWLQNTGDYCEGNLAKRQKNIDLFNDFLPSLEQFQHYINLELEIVNLERVEKLGVKPKKYNALLQEVKKERNWWQKTWQTIPENIRPAVADSELFNIKFLESIKAQFQSWQQELEKEQAYLSRYEKIVNKWIGKLRQPSEQDKQELRQIYIDNTNVIGITCSQAAGFAFKEFNSFDVVIIDEVSKCTPPELLMAALKGKKLVLIGDYRQLPPMLNESTIEEIAEELDTTEEDLSFLQDSLFKIQFETAADSIKQWLNTQYRMHPVIMGAINQFYDGRLICGLVEPDRERAHKITGKNIQENRHLIWVKMPAENVYKEQKEGTSYYNDKEVEVIDALCQEMEDDWAEKVANGEPQKEVGIITFYGAQLRRIEDMLNNRQFPSLHIRTGTVDRFQGMERPVIIVSLVRNNSDKNVGFAKKPERINVAFSRAQELLVIVGCHSLFTQHSSKVGSMYSKVSEIARLNGGLIDVSNILS